MVCAGLGAAAFAAGLGLFHDLEASWLVLIWHGSALPDDPRPLGARWPDPAQLR
jgi:hypothetical protein